MLKLTTAMRPKQWLKNLLVFAVPLAAGKIVDLEVMTDAFIAFVVFTLSASAVYLVNDVLDAEKDRLHPMKSMRPIAAGKISSRAALVAASLVGLTAIGVPIALGEWGLFVIVVVYATVQVGYQAGLRDVGLFDMTIVAVGFVLRTLAGGVSSELSISSGFLLVTGTSAMFVVSAKRFSELMMNENSDVTRPILRTYSPSYLRMVWTSSMIIAMVFYCLWAFELGASRDDKFVEMSTVPFSLIMLRYAFHADRGMAEAPETVVLTDRVLQGLALAWVGLFLLQAA